MTEPIHIVVEQVESMLRRDDKSSLTINCSNDGRTYSITFPRPVLAELILGLAGMQAPASGQPIDIPAVMAERIQPFQQPNATGLAVFLSGGWMIPLAIPASAHSQLRNTIAELELLAATPGGSA